MGSQDNHEREYLAADEVTELIVEATDTSSDQLDEEAAGFDIQPPEDAEIVRTDEKP